MLRCPACTQPLGEASRFCPACGASVDVSASPTGTAPRPRTPPASPAASRGHSSSDAARIASASHGRFVPGAILAERYRVVGLLGKGGMGEVYRADDLKLGQAVALKFLPESLERDPERLERFFGEVRIARQISHPAVCRVHDIGEVDGHHFLTMEHVDGEDLASLLRRIGRLPGDKAVDIARQTCAGLAAAHERGVLHRDLKPANVMIDGRGKARIMDFGLAALAESVSGAEVRSGTPAYMSPEQLDGKEVTVRSDVYALGLVLYELFTGKKAFEGGSVAEISRKHHEEEPEHPSGIVEDIDPTVDRVILRCLEKDPRARPPSALAVAAALPGGDPLAAALAAGETPSPEMVAAAGEKGVLRPALGWAWLAAFLLGLALVPFAARRTALYHHVPFEKAPAALEDRGKEILERLGHDAPAADAARGWGRDDEYLEHVQRNDRSLDRWKRLAFERPPALYFWYRQSPRPLLSTSMGGVVSSRSPPAAQSGMAGMRLDTRGRLVSFYSVTPQVEEPDSPGPPPDWSVLFAEAGLDPAAFRPAAPIWTPPFYCDSRAAWEGTFLELPGALVRIEAAGYRGRPVYFEIRFPWSRAERMVPYQFTRGQRVAIGIYISLLVAVTGVGLFLARRNLRLGRGDRKGAQRMAFYVLTTLLLSWVLEAGHVPDAGDEVSLAVRGLGLCLVVSGFVWVLYLALEPYVRRRWPDRMISWNRLLAGRWRDPLVGRDLLVGAAIGIASLLLTRLFMIVPPWLGIAPPTADTFARLDVLLGPGRFVAGLLDVPINALSAGMIIMLLLLVLRLVLRREWLAAVALVAIVGVPDALQLGQGPFVTALLFVLVAAIVGLMLFALLRFGFFALIAAEFFNNLLRGAPLTADPSAWYAGSSSVVLLLAAGLAVVAFRSALAGQALFKGELLSD